MLSSVIIASLVLLRHASALPGSPSGLDEVRPLSPRGRVEAGEAARVVARLRPGLSVVLSSPALRCLETARLVSAELGLTSAPLTLPALGLDAPASEPITLARTAAPGTLLVGHQPVFDLLVEALLRPGSARTATLPPAGACGLTSTGDGLFEMAWFATSQGVSHEGPWRA